MDLVVPSPGVPLRTDVLAAARERGVPLFSELELGYRASRRAGGTDHRGDRHQGKDRGLPAHRRRAAARRDVGRGRRQQRGPADLVHLTLRAGLDRRHRGVELHARHDRAVPRARRGRARGRRGPPRLARGSPGLPPVQAPNPREPDRNRLDRLRRDGPGRAGDGAGRQRGHRRPDTAVPRTPGTDQPASHLEDGAHRPAGREPGADPRGPGTARRPGPATTGAISPRPPPQ